jgi:hypothetical protein
LTDICGDENTAVRTATESESLAADTPKKEEEEEEKVIDELEGSVTGKEGEEDEPSGNLTGATLNDANRMMDILCGFHVHQNDGTHLDGCIVKDATW